MLGGVEDAFTTRRELNVGRVKFVGKWEGRGANTSHPMHTGNGWQGRT